MSALLKIDVDTGNVFARTLDALEQRNLPYAAQEAANRTAAEVQYQWQRLIRTQLDAPVRLTLNSVFMRKARYTRAGDGTRKTEAAEVWIRDEGVKGTAPARYLLPQVEGGTGHDRGIDRGLRRAGYLRPGEYAIPNPDSTLIDANGNVRNGVVQQILSQLGAQFDPLTNESADAKRARNSKARGKSIKQARNRRFFARSRHAQADGRLQHLTPGIYLRDGLHDLTKVYNFTGRPSRYRARLDLFGAARKAWESVFPYHLERELAKAVADAQARGWT